MKNKFLQILTLGLLFLITTSQTLAIEYAGIGGRPAYPDPQTPRSQDIFIHTIKPGESKQDGISVINNTEEEKYLLVYATDYTPSTGGGFACKQFLENKDSVGQWIKMNKNLVTLPAYSQSTVNFLIEVPENISPGEHNGCVAVQEYKPSNKDETGLSLSTRTAIRVAITIPGKIIQSLQIQKLSQKINKVDKIMLSPSIKNSGNTSVETNIKVKTWNTFGQKIKEQGGKYSILQDSTLELNFEIPRPIFGGIYHSNLSATYLKEKKTEKLQSPMIRYFLIPTKIGLLIILPITFLFIFLIILKIIKRKRNKWIKNNWQPYTIKANDSLIKIAEQKNVAWELLAKVNNLQPPYQLKAKSKLLAPADSKAKPKNAPKPKPKKSTPKTK